MERALIVARKEFAENLRAKKYWILIGIFVLLYLVSASMVAVFVDGTGDRVGERTRVVFALSHRVVDSLVFIAPLLGVALGFGAIAAEREKGTIRLVLARPIYRDDLVNGKLMAAVASFALAIGLSTATAVPLCVGLFGINVTAEDFARLMLLLVPAILFSLTYYAIALLTSVFAGRSGHALVVGLVLWFFLTFILPIIAYFIAFLILGPPPRIVTPPNGNGGIGRGPPPEYVEYFERLSRIMETVQLLSPNARFTSLAYGLFELNVLLDAYEGLDAIFAKRWLDVVVPVAYVVAFTALSHIAFLRRQETK